MEADLGDINRVDDEARVEEERLEVVAFFDNDILGAEGEAVTDCGGRTIDRFNVLGEGSRGGDCWYFKGVLLAPDNNESC